MSVIQKSQAQVYFAFWLRTALGPMCAQGMWWLEGFRGAGELGLSLKPPSTHPMANAALSLITLCVLFLGPQLIKAAGKLLDRASRVPRAGSHAGGVGRYDLNQPLFCPWFSIWSMKASDCGSSVKMLLLLGSVFEVGSGSLFPPHKQKQMKGCGWPQVTQHFGGVGASRIALV